MTGTPDDRADRPLLGLEPGKLRLEPHRAAWRAAYEVEAGRLAAALGGLACSLAHIGSTAVPGLLAKPILDLALVVAGPDEAQVAARLLSVGYVDRGRRPGGGGRVFIRTADGRRTHNLHLYHPSDPEWRDQHDFVAALRADPAHRAAYAAVKADLVGDPAVARTDYADAKGPVIRRILAAWRARNA